MRSLSKVYLYPLASRCTPGGQQGHPGRTLMFSPTPDEALLHAVERCEHCQCDLSEVAAYGIERRQVVDMPASRLLVQEHQAERKQCPACDPYRVGATTYPINRHSTGRPGTH